jgi:hypothetical protein
MSISQALRPLAGAAATACLLAGAACQGPVARRLDAHRQPSVTTAPASAAPTTAPQPAAPPSGQAVRTDDLDAGMQQADGQLSQTGSAVGDADQPAQQSND